jgi:predicted Zn-dependent protease with MMP-like domain
VVIDIEPGRFEEMVATALDGLPEDLGTHMRNVAVTVEQVSRTVIHEIGYHFGIDDNRLRELGW